jgi:hypothetical protein
MLHSKQALVEMPMYTGCRKYNPEDNNNVEYEGTHTSIFMLCGVVPLK